MLSQIFTTFPAFRIAREGLPADKVSTWPWLHTPLMAKWRYGLRHGRLDTEIGILNSRWFGGHVEKNMPRSDVFVGLSGAGLEPGKAAQRNGGIYICDRGSTHAKYQNDILESEHRKWHVPFRRDDPRIIARELSEYRQADHISVGSTFARSSFIESGIEPDKVSVIPYGVDLSAFEQCGEPPKDTFRLLFVGSFSIRKGAPYLLQAFRELTVRRKELVLVGSIAPNIKGILDLTRPDIKILGSIPNRELKVLMSQAHALVLPSVEEGLALVQAEAMACGCPVVATHSTGAADLFTSGVEGQIVPARDVDSLRLALEELAEDNHLRSRMSEAALRRVKLLGGWNQYGERYAALCNRLANRIAH